MSIHGYRRGSIFWAFTLIGIGCIFLWQNFNPSIHPWQIIAKFWPILIIFWGLSKLIDYVQAQAHPETVAPPLFTASEVILLILILALGTLISKVVLRPWQQWTGIDMDNEGLAGLFMNSYTYTQTLSHPAQPQPRLLVVDRRGDVDVRPTDQPNFDAVVKETIWAPSESDARKLSEQLKIEIVEQAGRSLLQTNLDSLPNSGRNIRLDVTLRAPKGSSTEITTERGDLILDGLKGEQAVTVRHGDAHITNVEGLVRVTKSGGLTEVRDLKGSLEVEGRGGDIDVSGVSGTVTVNGEFSGRVQFRNIAQTLRYNSTRTDMTAQKLTGRLNMEVGSLDLNGIDGPFELTTRQKDISLTDFKHSVKVTDNNGDVQLRTAFVPTHPVEVTLKKGQIELLLPPTSSFQIEASSPHGEVDCDFSGPELKVVKEGPNPSITGTVGKGGPMIRLITAGYGAIRVLRQGTLSPAPVPRSTSGKEETSTWDFPPRSRHYPALGVCAVSCEPARSLARCVASAVKLRLGLIRDFTRGGLCSAWDCCQFPRPVFLQHIL